MVEQKLELPEGWKWKTYNDIAELIRGVSYKKSDASAQASEGFIAVLRANNINQNLVFDDLVYVPENLVKDIQKVLENDIIVAMSSGSKHLVGKAAQAKSNLFMAFGAFCANLRVKKDECIDPKYVFYFYSSRENINRISDSSSGSNINNLKREHILNAPIPLAPIKQQKQIVAKIEELFSHIDAGIESLKIAKEKIKQYRQSVLKSAVTGELTKDWREANKDKTEPASQLLKRILKERQQRWEQQQLEQFQAKGKPPTNDKWKEKYKEPVKEVVGEIFELPNSWCWSNFSELSYVTGGLTKNGKRKDYPQQMPYLRVANVYANELKLDEVHNIGVNESELDRVLLEKDDLLIVEGNGSPDQIGRVAVWNGIIKNCVHQNHLIKARLVHKEMAQFFVYWMSSLAGRDEILKVASSTSGLYTLSISKIEKLVLPLAPLEEQKEIVQRVEEKLTAADRLMTELDTKLTQAQQQKQTILASAFKGELI